jgi:hypothetical protein
MRRFGHLREDVEFAALPQEQNPRGMDRERAEVVAAPCHAGQRRANFTRRKSPGISEILIGCTAIRNLRKSLKAKGGFHC